MQQRPEAGEQSSASEQVCVGKKCVPSAESNKCKPLKLEDSLWVRGITKRRVCNDAEEWAWEGRVWK